MLNQTNNDKKQSLLSQIEHHGDESKLIKNFYNSPLRIIVHFELIELKIIVHFKLIELI